ncbi:M50 family metallopeptidase [Paenibacillus eucommiae]|uniref:Stage IV sporulation protein FB n=1 Tax=Paenibacillus eucommiae TaxID=1355755 RepID=A0ABS4JAC2_9BACL|nr:M50 family metallopeptidase [Paenibacillus eucommiae]MBP1996792.1 stage IV sporulation protein FB [Paenibacillus eucommiae]
MIKWRGTHYRFHPLLTLMIIASIFSGFLLEALTLICIVSIHEMGHVVAAKGFGWRVREVQLLPFGGVAVVDELAAVPTHEELIVTLAGPLQHAWMIIFAIIMKTLQGSNHEWWDYFIEANLMIGLFNLLPVLPLDGGRVLQCLLGYILPYHRALWLTTWTSLFFGAVLIGFTLFQLLTGQLSLNLFVIGLFLLISNWYSYKQLPYHFLRFLMNRGDKVSRLLLRGALAQPIVVNKQRKISDILKLLMREKYHLIYIVNDKGSIQRVLPEQRLITGYLEEKKPGCAVSELFM